MSSGHPCTDTHACFFLSGVNSSHSQNHQGPFAGDHQMKMQEQT